MASIKQHTVAGQASTRVVVLPGIDNNNNNNNESVVNNVFGNAVSYHYPKTSLLDGSKLTGQAGQLNSLFVAGKDVPSIVPYLYKISRSSPTASAQSVIYVVGQPHNISSILETGFAVLIASNLTEFHELSLLASTIALRQGLAVSVWLLTTPLSPLTPPTTLSSFSPERVVSLLSKDLSAEPPKAWSSDDTIALFNHLASNEPSSSSVEYPNKTTFNDTAVLISEVLSRRYAAIEFIGDASAEHIVVAYPDVAKALLEHASSKQQSVGIIVVRVIRPWSAALFLSKIPKSTKKIQVLDIVSDTACPPPLFLDVAGSFHLDSENTITPELISVRYNGESSSNFLDVVISNFTSAKVVDGALPDPAAKESTKALSSPDANNIAAPYIQMLQTAFTNRLKIIDASNEQSIENVFGNYVAYIREREAFSEKIIELSKDKTLPADLREALNTWHSCRVQSALSEKHGTTAVKLIERELPNFTQLKTVHEKQNLFFKLALWILGSENWANDLQYSGIHHVISSGVNVNLLLVDTQKYPSPQATSKKDIGLYAMNYGNSYVASVAIYNNYTHVLHSLLEAELFDGPSLVLAYLPLPAQSETTTTPSADTIQIMKNSKVAVDLGLWPLYRWNPVQQAKNGQGFSLESERIKSELKSFLERENALSIVVKSIPELPLENPNSLSTRLNRLEESFSKLSAGLAPLLILYGSDTGHAESLAKKMEAKGKRNKRNARALPLDSVQPSDLQSEPTVLFVLATAGQGEFTADAKEFWKTLQKLSAGDINLEKMDYSVFALGDSHYWPAPAGEAYFCKPGKELDAKLESLGAKKVHPIGLGDDQDADGLMTGFAAWEQGIWDYLGVAGDPGAAPPVTDDQNKINSNFLRGTIAQGLLDTSTGALAELDTKITKFHGIYQQDDRDLRDARKAQGLEKAFSFMVRLRIPGGIVSPAQYLALDTISDQYASSTIRLTTRQTIQYHGIIKKNLRTSMQAINKTLLDTIAACGDVNRNVLCTSNPALAPSTALHQELVDLAVAWSTHMLPKTTAYHEIWLDDKLVKGGDGAVQDFEPIYGPNYLPRKFKAVIAMPPYNDVDIYAHDLGYIPIIENDKIIGYNVTVGGGMGMTHGNKKTYPRLADVLGFVEKHQAIDVGEKVVLVQRDHGDRTNRKHARLKYTIEDHGIDWFRSEVEARLGYKIAPAKPFHFTDNSDRYGWLQGSDGKWHYTMFIQNGRVKDVPGYPLRTGLRELAKVHKGDFRFTANQNLIIGNVDDQDKSTVDAIFEQYKMANKRHSAIRLNSMACVALPTCGLAFAESERYLPSLITLIEEEFTALGIWDEAITIRMTGCPNGCARPYIAEIGLVGKAPGIYNLYIGAGFHGERLSKLFKEAVNEKEILEALRPVIRRYAKEKNPGEHFGDFVVRVGIIKRTNAGRDFHDL